jgi:DNA helicase-2/ATP-dependent DNA helicase PcrA
VDATDLLVGLDPDQRLAVASPSPLLAVIAGAGSGKTSVLTRRLAHRVLSDAADPSHVVALTFTRQAASELRRRLRRIGIREQVAAGTFHATALALLRQHWQDRGRSAPAVTNERHRIVGDVLGSSRREATREVVAEIDWARARLVDPHTYERAARAAGRRTTLPPATVAEVFAGYESAKRSRGVIDLDDLLSETLDLMQHDRAFADAARWRFRHLFVDEAQDLNPLQAALLDTWRAGRDDLTLVGDPSQAIYGFNGADPTLLDVPERRFPGIEVVRLGTNYRCTPAIVAAGVAVLGRIGPPPDLRSARPDGREVTVRSFPDAATEAAGIARIVREMRAPGGSWRAVAVLTRTNAQLSPIAEALAAVGIPTRLSGAARAATPLQRALREAGDQTSRHLLASWAVDAAQFESTHDDADAAALVRVASAVDEFLAFGGGDGPAFLSWVRATDPFQDNDDRFDAVELLTFHAAKGREWTNVVAAGVCTGLVPHGSASSEAERAEETRLLYVALTRAADQVVVTWPATRHGRKSSLSPLLGDVSTLAEPPAPPPVRRATPRTPDVDPVLSSLTAWRERAARAASMSPTAFLPDRTLAAIATARPATPDELAAITGVGPMMARRFADRILPLTTTAPVLTIVDTPVDTP